MAMDGNGKLFHYTFITMDSYQRRHFHMSPSLFIIYILSPPLLKMCKLIVTGKMGGHTVQWRGFLSVQRALSHFPFSHGFCVWHLPISCRFPNMMVNWQAVYQNLSDNGPLEGHYPLLNNQNSFFSLLMFAAQLLCNLI